ncbi:2-keto-4-pentenoate hydratase [Halomonas sp. GXIMD04776]|uniref:2-keto-4-pentenoate hydratase n=1 Tax=Halomonas sp. GXIMD04776 TaxID=3415605 RepID=UPI003C9691CE
MTHDEIVTAGAQRLIEAHERHTQIAVPECIPLADATDAYVIQERVSERLGTPSGWKLGGIIKGEVPRFSRLFSELSQRSPGHIAREDYHLVFLEPELAVVLGDDLPARDEPYRLEEIAERVASLHAAIEVVDSRFQSWPEVPPLWQLADGLSHGSFVLGSGIDGADLKQMKDAVYRLTLDGEVALSGRGNHPGGDPALLLMQMINTRVATSGEGFRAGEVITTGTFDGVVEMRRGHRAWLVFEGIGEVELNLD